MGTSADWVTVGGARLRSGELGFEAPDVGVYRYDVDAVAQTIAPRPLEVKDLPAGGDALLHRAFHNVAVIPTDEGTAVLVVGGLAGDGKATDSVLVLRHENGPLRFDRELHLAHARFGAALAPLGSAVLSNAYVLSGGFVIEDGAVENVYGSEIILWPAE